ncbi:hypothetical protein L1785_06655 [Antribacter sp. KLBMP9083]|uniref:Uncharacterized protein n=1 Tax=Antribacter soli TaxID=2910976 RepID=A0AA41QCF1_9MICO|nr:hypothetical protein [Antribacter soli]MCF4120653.1 hypothetical protein [Antribacter soli]
MTIVRRFAATVTAAGCLLLGLSVPAAPASAADSGYYVTEFDGYIWHGTAAETYEHISYSQWASAGFPAPTRVDVDYVRYSWSPNIFARFTLPATWAYGEPVEKASQVTFGEWRTAGYPTPATASWIPESFVSGHSTSDELFLQDPPLIKTGGGWVPSHKLSYAEWVAIGSPEPHIFNYQGFFRYGWTDKIFVVGGIEGWEPTGLPRLAGNAGGHVLTYDEWVHYGSPTPMVVDSLPGDVLWKWDAFPTLYYQGPQGVEILFLTWDEWSRMGFRTPTVRPYPS